MDLLVQNRTSAGAGIVVMKIQLQIIELLDNMKFLPDFLRHSVRIDPRLTLVGLQDIPVEFSKCLLDVPVNLLRFFSTWHQLILS